MNRTCEECGVDYDDARATTICPHGELMPAEDLRRKDHAIALVNKMVRFKNANPTCARIHEIQAILWNGMVILHGQDNEVDALELVEVA